MKTKQRNTRKKNKLSLYAALVLFLFIHYVVFPAPCALGDDILPRDPLVQAGDPTITSDGRDMTVNAGVSDKTWIDWQGGFNIGAQNSVNNLGPSSAAVILHNDVTGVISDIQGALTGNCNVFLLNPSGIIFGQGAQVNVGGLVVSTLNMSMDDFMSGDYKFKDENLVSMSSIVNSGIINSQNPAGVTLIAGAVRNEGVINANLGTVNLVTGSEVTLNINNEGSIQVAVNKEVLSNVYDKDGNRVSIGVDNVGDINANGGQVYIEAEAANDVFDTLINQSGVVKAGSMVEKDGKIILVSNSEGIVQNTGTLDASAIEAGATGGEIEITGSKVGQFGAIHADAIDGNGGNIELRASKVVALGPDSVTTANAGLNGDGGNVIVFSPDTALMAPTAEIAVRGGDNSGDGGFVEVSGQKYVEINGIVDRCAPNGEAGLLLIDPTDITINDAGVDDTLWTVDDWADNVSNATSQIDIDTLIGHIANGPTTITTVSGGAGPGGGDITLNAVARTLTNVTANSLTLTAQSDITITTAINFAGAGNLNLNATGAVAVNNSITLTGGTFDSNGTSFTSNASGTITTNGGGVDLSGHSGAITIGAAINSGAGTFHSHGTTFDNTGGIITTTDTSATAVQINNTGVVTIGANILSSGTIIIDSASSVSVAATATGNTCTSLDINTAGTFNAAALSTITGGGAGTDLNIDAAGITLNGTAGGQLIQTSTGTITLNSTGAGNDIALANNSINIADGTLSLTAVDEINGSNDGIAEIDADGNVTFNANGIGNTANVEITGDGGGDRTLTVTDTGAKHIFIDELTNQFNQVTITQQNIASSIAIDFSDADFIDIHQNGAAIDIAQVYTSNGNVGFTYTTSVAAAMNVATTTFNTGTAAASITASGAFTQTAAMVVGGTLTLAPGAANNITLANDSNNFATVVITNGNNIHLHDANTLDLGASTVTGNLDVTAVLGNITDSGTVTVGGTASFTTSAANADIDLGTLAVTGKIDLHTSGTGDAMIINTIGVDLDTSSIGQDLTVTATTGNIIDSNTITVGRNASFTTAQSNDDINLGTLAVDGTISVNTNGATGNATIVNDTAIVIANSTVGGILNVTATIGNITDNGDITAGTLAITNAATYSTTLDANNNITYLGAITAPAGFSLHNGENGIMLTGAVVASLTGAILIDTGTSGIDTNDQIITTGSGAITLISDLIDLGTTADTITTTGTVTLQPSTTTTAIGITGGAGAYSLTQAELDAITDGAGSIVIGRSDGAHAIIINAVSLGDPTTIQTPSGGSITVAGQITGSGNASVTLDGSGATTTLNADIITAGTNITISDNVLIGENLSITLSTGAGSAGNISITGTTDGTAGGVAENLTLISGTGTTTLTGAVGGTTALGTLALQSNAGTETGTVTFTGAVTANTLTTYSQNYAVIFNGGGTITTDTNFLNDSGLTLGNEAADTITFTGGLDTTGATGTLNVAGTVVTTNTRMDIGAVTLTAATTFDTGNNAAGILNVGAVTSGGNSLTLDSGSTALATIGLTSMANLAGGLTIRDAGGLVTITGAVGDGTAGNITITDSQAGVTFASTVAANTVTLTDTTGTITFSGNATINTGLTTASQGYNVAFSGALNSIAGATTFSNTGTLVIGAALGATTFTGGLVATAPSSRTLNGTINTTNTAMTLGAVTLGSATTLDTGNAAAGTISVGAVTSAGNSLALDSGSTAGATISVTSIDSLAGGLTITDAGGLATIGTIGAGGTGTVTITDSTAGVTFSGNVTATTLTITDTTAGQAITFADGQTVALTTLTTLAPGYNVIINSTTFGVTNLVEFLNAGTVTLGNSGSGTDTLTFTGGVETTGNATNPTLVNIGSRVVTVGQPIVLGAVTLTAASELDTGNAATGTITVGAVTSGSNSLTLDSGSTALATINLTSMANLTGGLTIRDAGGLATIGAVGTGTSGPITITDSQAGVTFSGAVTATTFTITDTDNGDDITFADGQTVSLTSLVTAAPAYDVIINSTTFGVTNLVEFLNAGIVTLGDDGSATDTLTFTGGVETTGNATNPATVNIASRIVTVGQPITLGAVTLTAASELDTGNAAGGTISVGAVTGAFGLTLDSGSTPGATISLASKLDLTGGLTIRDAGGLVTVSGALGTGTAGDITITDSSLGVTFSGAVTANTLTITDTTDGQTITFDGDTTINTALVTTANGYNVAFNGTTNLITPATTFNNTGTLTLGNASGDTITFTGGFTATAPSSVSIGGTVNTTNTAMSLGVINLSTTTVLNAGNSNITATGTINGAQALTLTTTGNVDLQGVVGGLTPLASLTVSATATQVDLNNVTTTGSQDITATNIDLNGTAYTSTTAGNVHFHGAVDLIASPTVASNNGDVTFTVGPILDPATTNTLTVNADNGTASFVAVGGATDPNALIVTAANTSFGGTVEVGAGGLRVNGSGGTTTILADITSADDITINDSVIFSGDRILTSGLAAGDDISITGTINATAAGDDSLTLAAGAGGVTLGDSVGTTTALEDLTITSTGVTTLNNSIIASGAAAGEDIDLSGASNVQLASNVSLRSTNQDVILDAVNGAFDLTVNAGVDITVGDTIGATNALHDIAMTAGVDVNVNFAITATGTVDLTSGGAAGEDIALAANVIGTAVTFNAGALGTTTVTVTQDNTSGSTTYNGLVTLDGTAADTITLTSLEDMTFNGVVTATDIGAGGITSTNGSLDFNADLSGGDTINLNAANGGINLTTVGAGTDPTVLDLDSLTAELGGVIGVVAIDTTGVGLTTLAADVSITASSAAGILLGDLTGAKTLTLVASSVTGVITLLDADIGALSITDSNTVNFNGNFVTSGAASVTGVDGEIDVAAAGSIQAGGLVTLSNNAAAGIDINGAVTGTGGVAMTATAGNIAIDANVTTSGNSTITLTATAANVNVAQAAASSVTGVNGTLNLTAGTSILLGAGGVTAGQIVTTGTGLIDLNATTAFTMDSSATTKVKSGGAIDIDPATATIDGAGLEAVGNITVDATDTIQVNGVVNSTSGSTALTVTNVVVGAPVATINVTANLIGDNVTVTALDASAGTEVINVTGVLNNNRGGITFEPNTGTLNIDSNITAQDFITLNGAAAITLAANLTAADNNITVNDALTLDGGAPTVTATSGSVTFSGTINGAQALTVNALSGTATFTGIVGGVTRPASLTVSAQTANLNANISTADDGNVDFSGTTDVTLTAAVVIDTELGDNGNAGDILFKPAGRINGAFALSLDAGVAGAFIGGAIQLGIIGNSAALASLTVDNDAATTDGVTTLYGNITTTGAITMSDADNIDLAGNVTMMTTNSLVNLGGAAADTIDGSYTLTIDAGTADVTLPLVGGTTPLAALSVTDSGSIDLLAAVTAEGTIYIKSDNAAAAAIDADGAITSTGGSITLIALGALSGLDLNADILAATNATLTGDIVLSATADAITATNGTITINGNITGAAADLVLTGNAATVAANALDATPTWTVDSLTTTAVGLTTLNATTAIVADGSGAAITLGALDGANALTLTSSAVDGDIILNAADIASLIINDADDVTFSGAFVTSGNTTVSTAITGTIIVDGSINAGGTVTLANNDGAAPVTGAIDINGAVTGTGGVAMTATAGNIAIDADVTTSGDSVITLTATAGNVNVAQAAASAVTAVNGNIDVDAGTSVLLGAVTPFAGQLVTTGTGSISIDAVTAVTMAGTGSQINSGGAVTIGQATQPVSITTAGSGITAVGNITTDADDATTINGVIQSTSGSVNIEVSEDNASAVGTVTVAANVIGDDVTITASDATASTALITVTSALNNNRGGYTFEPNDGTLNIDSNITAQDFITLNGTLAITLAANLTATDNDITVADALTLDGGAPIVTATSGDVTFSSTINGAMALTVSALNGTATFTGIVGGTTEVTTLTVSADIASLNANISSEGNVDFTNTDVVTLTAAVTIDSEADNNGSAGYINFKPTGTINGAQTLSLDAGTTFGGATGGAIQLGTVGNSTALTSLTVDNDAATDGVTTLYGNITTTGAITMTDANDINLAGNVTMMTTNSNVILGGAAADLLDGSYTLTIDAGTGDVTLPIVGGTTALAALSVTDSGSIDLLGAVIAEGDIYILADNNTADSIDADAAITSTGGNITLIALGGALANMDLNGDLSAALNVTLNGHIELSATADAISSTNGTIAISGNITGADANLVLSADAVTVSGNILDTTPTWTLNSLTSTNVGLMTLTTATAIVADDDDGDSGIDLGPLAGDYGLTLTAQDAVLGHIILQAADISSLIINDAVDVTFNGAFETSGAITVGTAITGDITVANTGSIQAGGNVSLITTVGGDDIILNGNVNTTGTSTITLTSVSDVNIAQTASASVNAVNGEIEVNTAVLLLGDAANTYAGQIVTTGTGLIDINNAGSLTMNTNTSTKISGGGGVDIAGASSIANEVIATNAGNVLFTGAVTLVGNTTVGSDNGNVTFTSTVGGAFSLAANAPNGIVTFSSTVGAVTDELTLLTVTANEARLAGNISTDGGTTADIDFRGTDLVTLTAAVILDTETTGNDVAGDILFGTSSSVVGAFGLTINADSAAGDGNFQINDADVGQFTISAASVATATLYGTILSDNAIDLSGAATITLGDTASLQTTAADQDITIGTGAAASTLNGAHPLTITSTGDVSFDVVNALTELIVVADTVDFTDAVSMPGDITVNTWTAADLDEIDVQAAFDSTNGSITFTGRTELNNAAFSAGQNITLNSDTVITTGVTITADNGYIDLNAEVNEAVANPAGTDNLTLTAPFGTVYARLLGTTKSLNVLDINSLAAELAGNITAVAVDATGVGLSTLTADITINASGAAGILLSDLDGAKTLTLIASSSTGVITLLDADIGALSITDSNTVNFNGNFVTSGAASVAGVDDEIDVAAAGSVQSGGSVTFTTTGAGTVVDINGPVSSDVDISFDASTAGTISVDSTVTARGVITMLVDVDLNINAAVNSTMAGNIIMTADIGDINLSDEVRTTSTGDVSLTATLGSIIDADTATEDERIAGDVVTLTALENIGTAVAGADIDTEANSLDISSTDAVTARTIVIDEYDAVVLTDLDTALGSITVSADGLITATDVNASGAGEDVTLTTTTGGMILTSVLADDDITATADAGDITIALVGDAGTDDIAITATTGAIDEVAPEDVGVDIVGDAVTLTAQNGIGHARKLETTIASLDASVTSTGDIQIAETDAIILTDLDTVDGSITVSAGGLITATDVNASGVNQDVTLTTTAGGIILTSVLADDDITATANVGDITIDVAGDAGTDDITITATTGSINGVDLDAAAEITGDAVILTAQDEIGGASGGATEIETEVTTISADSTTAGDIIFEELDADGDGINLLSIDTNNGNITIVTNGVTHEAGTETIITSVKSDTGVAGANDISITASTGDITLAGNAANINNVQSDDDITIIATAGSITEDASVEIPGDSYVDIQGDKLTITSRDEIGSSIGEYDIETTIANLDASSTTAGDIIITETNAIGLDDVDTANGAITIIAGGAIVATDVVSTTDADANDITITATAGDVTIGVITAGAGVAADASITATAGSINEIGAGDAAVDITADVLTLSCQDEIGGVGELDIETTVNSLTTSSTVAGDTYITETNAITLTSVATTDGLITIISGGNMTVTSVTAGGDTGSNDDVTLTTTVGDIIMSGDITALNDAVTLTSAGNITDTTSGATDISAADLVITANAGTVGAIGANNELDTDVDTITAAVNGAIYILEDSAVSLLSVVTTAGLIDIEAAGAITTTTVTANGGFGVDLYASAGNLLDTAGGMITATGESTLEASGVVGTNANPMDVNINGRLWILAGSMQDEVSANIAGTVNGGDATERVEILLPAPPGLVLLDNHLMGGGNYGSGSTNGTILSRGYGYTAIVRADMFSSVYQQELQPWGHNMMLPWVLIEGAVINNDFLSSLPAVIDVSQLNLPVISGMNQTANFYVIRSLK